MIEGRNASYPESPRGFLLSSASPCCPSAGWLTASTDSRCSQEHCLFVSSSLLESEYFHRIPLQPNTQYLQCVTWDSFQPFKCYPFFSDGHYTAAAMSSSPAAALQSPLHAPATNPGAQFHRQSRTAARTRFYAHRVRESLPSRAAAFLCSILLTLLLIAGIIVFILWLNLRPHRPRFYLSSFSFPSLSPSSPISFDVSARNANSKIAISYGDVGAAVFYNGRQIASSSAVLSAFYQPPKNTTEIRGQLIATAGAFPGDTMASRVDLRLELNALVQFRLSAWDTHHHELHVSCDLAVGPDGNLLPEFQSERCSVYFG